MFYATHQLFYLSLFEEIKPDQRHNELPSREIFLAVFVERVETPQLQYFLHSETVCVMKSPPSALATVFFLFQQGDGGGGEAASRTTCSLWRKAPEQQLLTGAAVEIKRRLFVQKEPHLTLDPRAL